MGHSNHLKILSISKRVESISLMDLNINLPNVFQKVRFLFALGGRNFVVLFCFIYFPFKSSPKLGFSTLVKVYRNNEVNYVFPLARIIRSQSRENGLALCVLQMLRNADVAESSPTRDRVETSLHGA